MKILKYILIAIGVLLVIFLVIGFLNPSVHYGYTITVDKPIEEAWAVSEDASKYDQWLEGFQSMELISGEYGEVGSKYKIIVHPGEGQEEFEMIETVVSKEVNDHISMDFTSEMMDFKQTINFSESDGTTTVSTDSEVMAKGIFLRAMFAMMESTGGGFTKQEGKNMEALKVLIEENTTDYFSEPEPETVEESAEMEESQE